MKLSTTLPMVFAVAALAQQCEEIPASERTGYGFVDPTAGPVWGAIWAEDTATSASGSSSIAWGKGSATSVSGSSSGWGKSSATSAVSGKGTSIALGWRKSSTTTSAAGKSLSASNPWGQGSGSSVAWGKDHDGWDSEPSTVSSWLPGSYGHFTGQPNKLTSTPTSSSPSGPKYSGNSTMSGNWTTNSTSSQWAAAHPGCQNGPNSRGCWGNGFSINTDYETSWPNTGRVVRYELEVQNVTLSPDGTPKHMLVVNGQYPGPLIEANWGDMLEITVKNSLDCNGTSMHWHGFRQLKSNPQDGVNGITECPIAPGDSRVYRFQATQYGTTWYHSHFSAQYGDGVNGPLVIHGPAAADYDIDLGHVQIAEFYNLTICQEDWFAERFGPPTASNYLINGQNIKPDGSTGTRTKFNFTPGKKHLLRLINTSVDNHFKFTLDGHIMMVISNDFVPINPYTTNILNINIGQRYEVVIEANQPAANYWARAIIQTSCGTNENSGLGTANAIVGYIGAGSLLPTSTYANYTDACEDEPGASLVPIVAKSVDSTGFAAQASALPVNIERVALTTNDTVFRWTLNGISQDIDWSNPTISQVISGNQTFPVVKDVITLSTANVWTFWIIQNQFFVPHPMHLHGHDFSLLGQGAGTFDPAANLADLNFVNPPRRDVAILLASGWTVIAFKTDNPGAWLMHCHIAWHVGEGLALQFLELPDQITTEYGNYVRGSDFQHTCANWVTFDTSAENIYAKTDSGLKKRGEGFSDVKRRINSHEKMHSGLRHARRHEEFHSYE